MVSESFGRLWRTLKELAKDRKILIFLVAYFFYIDGVYTIIDMATAYGTALGLDTTGLLLALLVTQIVAFPSAIVFGKLTKKYPSANLITVCILAYTGIAIFAMFMESQFQFWILAVCVGLFQGGIQALSRSHFAKLIPPEKSGEYFGLLDICGKGASFIGNNPRGRGVPAHRQHQPGCVRAGGGVCGRTFPVPAVREEDEGVNKKEKSVKYLNKAGCNKPA